MSRRLLDKLPKLLEEPEFAAAWEDTRDEFALAREIICARVAAGLSQKELADKIGTTQSVIARLESGTHTPSVSTLKMVAVANNAKLNIGEFNYRVQTRYTYSGIALRKRQKQ